ncbi:MAG TPA: DUF5666 domain-containing protein [Terriglobales bacterium]|nr:DUF5666 domain-containing protein [Terriglobales bacterium]
MDRVAGTVVSISADAVVIKPETGDSVTVKISPETRIRKDRNEAKLSDFKAGDRIFAAGKLNEDKSLAAVMIGGGEMGGGRMMMMGPGGQPPSPEELVKMGLGTRFVVGEVKAIDETKLIILRPDGQSQTIEVDESTSFRSGRDESVTLADVKVGDRIMARGEMKNGIFVPQSLRIGGGPGGPMIFERHGEGDAPPQQHK